MISSRLLNSLKVFSPRKNSALAHLDGGFESAIFHVHMANPKAKEDRRGALVASSNKITMYHPILTHFTFLLYLHILLFPQNQALNCNVAFPTTPQTSYPNRAQIHNIFSHLAGANINYTLFFEQVLDNVNWTIEGTHARARWTVQQQDCARSSFPTYR